MEFNSLVFLMKDTARRTYFRSNKYRHYRKFFDEIGASNKRLQIRFDNLSGDKLEEFYKFRDAEFQNYWEGYMHYIRDNADTFSLDKFGTPIITD